MFVRHGFMNCIQIGKYKANADATVQFCDFDGNVNK